MTNVAARDTLLRALALQRGGEWSKAEEVLRTLINHQPEYAEAWHGLGITLQRLGHHNQALACARQAAKCGPGHPGIQYNLGVALQECGAIEAARAAFAAAVSLKPEFVQAWNNLGLVLQDLRRFDEAAKAFRQALALRPDYVRALHNLGNLLLFTGYPNIALQHFRRLRTLDPADGAVRSKEAMCLLRLRSNDEAKASLDHDLARLARLCAQMNDSEGAMNWYRHLAMRDAGNWVAQFEARLALPAIYVSAEAVLRSRQGFIDGMAQLVELQRQIVSDESQILRAVERDNFFLAYQGEDDLALQVSYAGLVRQLLEPLVPVFVTPSPSQPAGLKKWRIGFASAFFRNCTAGQYFKSWITDLDPARFEKFVYAMGGPEDEVSEEIRRAATCYVRLEQPLPEAARHIRGDELDVIIFPELGMHGRTYALAALRLAPVQCAGWGHPVTSGHASVDYVFSSALMEPQDGDQHYVEELIHLPGLGTRYEKPEVGASFARADFGLPEQAHLYFFPHAPFKVHPDNDASLARILEQDSQGILVLFEGESRWMTEALLARFSAHGIAAERIRVLPTLPRASYLEINRLCDLMLDACRWSGGNTTLDAIAAGLPVVTRHGRFMRGRQSAGMLAAMGLSELIADNDEQYVALALRLARERPYRDEVACRMIAGCGRIFDDPQPIRALERFFSDLAEQP